MSRAVGKTKLNPNVQYPSVKSGKERLGLYDFVMVALSFVALYFQLLPSKEISVQTLAILASILLVVIVYFVYAYVSSVFKQRFEQIDDNTDKIRELEKKFDIEKRFLQLEKQILLLKKEM